MQAPEAFKYSAGPQLAAGEGQATDGREKDCEVRSVTDATHHASDIDKENDQKYRRILGPRPPCLLSCWCGGTCCGRGNKAAWFLVEAGRRSVKESLRRYWGLGDWCFMRPGYNAQVTTQPVMGSIKLLISSNARFVLVYLKGLVPGDEKACCGPTLTTHLCHLSREWLPSRSSPRVCFGASRHHTLQKDIALPQSAYCVLFVLGHINGCNKADQEVYIGLEVVNRRLDVMKNEGWLYLEARQV